MNSQKEYNKIFILRVIGNFLLFSSLFFIGRMFYKPAIAELHYLTDKLVAKKYIVATNQTEAKQKILAVQAPKKNLLAQTLKVKTVEALIPEDPQFSIVIPKIDANAKIISNVDVTNEPAYLEALNEGVAHAAGTAFPGEGGHIYLFAHSTDYFWNVGTYNAVFYLLYKLQKGDEINIFYKGQRYVYRMIDSKIVDPSQVQYLTRKTNREFLTLQTCWPPGTTLQRLLVFAVREAD